MWSRTRIVSRTRLVGIGTELSNQIRGMRKTLPSYTLVDVGARYQFRIGKALATFRVQMQNFGNNFAWKIVGSNSYGVMDKRRITAFVAADF